MNRTTMKAFALSAALVSLAVVRGVEARQPADVASKLTGTWVLNRELSSGFAAPGRGRGRGGAASAKATAPRPLFAMTASASAFAQRGGAGGGDASDLTP